MPISLSTFCNQYLSEFDAGAAHAALAKFNDRDRTLEDWRSLWTKALSQPVA